MVLAKEDHQNWRIAFDRSFSKLCRGYGKLDDNLREASLHIYLLHKQEIIQKLGPEQAHITAISVYSCQQCDIVFGNFS